MIRDMNQKEIEEYVDLQNKRTDNPQEMMDGDWERLHDLQEKRFEGE